MLAWVTATPAVHRTHHSPAVRETNSNYAGVLIVWDRLLGTYRPGVADGPTGLDVADLTARQTVRALALEPVHS